jgi:carbamoyltransferase
VRIYGISAGEHDASITVLEDARILFAAQSERYSRIKNDAHLHHALIREARSFGEPDIFAWYEKPFRKLSRKALWGPVEEIFRLEGRRYLREFGLAGKVRYVGHHRSHAAAGYFTSPFNRAAILVADAVGEWDTITAWVGTGDDIVQIWSVRYPHSLGLLYSAFAERIGLRPNEEEYIMMGMAALGAPVYRDAIWNDFVEQFEPPRFRLSQNVHCGLMDWRRDLSDPFNIAASMQSVTEDILLGFEQSLAKTTGEKNLVLMGGLALNCVANSRLAKESGFSSIWIMPNPGDAGSSLGAAAAVLSRHIDWKGPYLGHDIARPFDFAAAVAALVAGDVIGVANGRAEFGPRALGHRSVLTDPRSPRAKDKINDIKRREPFRPFAPAVLAEKAATYFDMPVVKSPYMQFVADVRTPEYLPGISHADGTARVQTVTQEENPLLHEILVQFESATGCPVLLNTSMNVKGEPLVNTWNDAKRFSFETGVSVF